MTDYRVGVTAAFENADGSKNFPSYDLAPLIATAGIAVETLPADEAILNAETLDRFDSVILLGERVTRDSLRQGIRLKHIARVGVGYDTIDVPACTDHDVVLTITPDGVRRPMAVAILAFVLSLSTNLMDKDRIVRTGPKAWPERFQFHGTGLVGRVLGSIGIGNIGREMFRLAKPFDMRMICCDPYVDPAIATELGVEMVDLDTVFRQSDFLTCNCPLTEETRHIVNAERLSLMKSTAYLINTSRGPVVEQRALYDVLSNRRIAGAGIDVFEDEPTSEQEPLLQLDNVLLAPHALGWSDQMFSTMAGVNRKAILAVRDGAMPENIVNAAIADRESFKRKIQA